MPAKDLYDVAREVCHHQGMDWVDPRDGSRHPAPPILFEVGDWVKKLTGDYTFVGEVIMSGRKRSGVPRYAVENAEGLIHIFNGFVLEKIDPP